MYKHFLIKKENNQIVSISDGKLIFDENIFYSKKINITNKNMENFQQGNIPILEDNKLKFRQHPDKEKRIEIETLKEKINKVKNIEELKNLIINNLIN